MFSDSNRIIAQGSSAPPKPDRPTRQFRVTHTATGLETYVMAPMYQHKRGWWTASYASVAQRAGLRYPLDCTVTLLWRDEEIPLPFDDCPLVIRRGFKARLDEQAPTSGFVPVPDWGSSRPSTVGPRSDDRALAGGREP